MFKTPAKYADRDRSTRDGNVARADTWDYPKGTKLDAMTEQHHKEAVQVENILKKFRDTGVITHTNQHEGQYGNFVDAQTFAIAHQNVAEAKSMFESLPSHIRNDMANSVENFLEFIHNPENRQAILDYGLSDAHLGPSEDNLQDQVPKYPDYPENLQAAPRVPPTTPPPDQPCDEGA